MHEYYKDTPTFSMKYLDSCPRNRSIEEILDYTREYLETLKDFYSETFKQLSIQDQ